MTVATEARTIAPTRKSNPCYRCDGTGIYRWGTIVNGVSSFQGTCFRCNGNGVDPSAYDARKAVKEVKEVKEVKVANPEMLKSLNELADHFERVAKYGPESDVRHARTILADAIGGPLMDAQFYAPNVYAYLIECIDRVIAIRFGNSEPEAVEPEAVEPETTVEVEPEAVKIPLGTYTIETEDGHFTVRLKEGSSKLSGKTIIEYLYGPDNELNFRAFGFVKPDGTIQVWTRFQHNTIGKVRAQQIVKAFTDSDAVEKAGQAYALKSGRCRRCGRTLTVPASIHRGFGPDCFEKVQ